MNIVNIAIQVLPKSENKDTYAIIDKAIEVIKKANIKYQVCPFETVMEGEYNKLMQVISDMQTSCFKYGADELLINLKMQIRKDTGVTIDEKMKKYK